MVEDYVQEIGQGGETTKQLVLSLFLLHVIRSTFMVEYNTLHSQCKNSLNLITIWNQSVRVVLFGLKHVSVACMMLFSLSLCTADTLPACILIRGRGLGTKLMYYS
jgi:hypothetical protein